MAPASRDLEVLYPARGNKEREVSMGSSFEREAREYARSSATACRISQELVPLICRIILLGPASRKVSEVAPAAR